MKKLKRPKGGFWNIALLTLLMLGASTTTADILDNNNSESGLIGFLIIPAMPGFILYVLVTGDVHGWQPGPIGQAGRIIVTTLGSWVFWTPLFFGIYRMIVRKRDN